MYENKRRHKRVPLAASALIQYSSEESTEQIHVVTANISLSGLGVYSEKPIIPGTALSIEISFISSQGLTTTDSIRGENIFDRKIGGMHFINIQFDEEINPVKQPSLYDHLLNILSWQDSTIGLSDIGGRTTLKSEN